MTHEQVANRDHMTELYEGNRESHNMKDMIHEHEPKETWQVSMHFRNTAIQFSQVLNVKK